MSEITNRDELIPSKYDAFAEIYGKPSVPAGSKKYILEFKPNPMYEEKKKAVAYYLKPENDRYYGPGNPYNPPNIIQNSVWYIPSEENNRIRGTGIYRGPQPYATNGIRVFEMPTRGKEIMTESLIRQRTGIELPEEIKASIRKSIRNNNMGGKRRKARKSSRRHRKSLKKTRRHRRK
jgi:hypothetical protein